MEEGMCAHVTINVGDKYMEDIQVKDEDSDDEQDIFKNDLALSNA